MSNNLSDILDGIKAVIFDLDGTLIDSMWLWKQIDIDFLGRYGISLPTDLQASICGMSFRETADYFKMRFNLPLEAEAIMNEWNRMAFKLYTESVPLKKGARRFLQFLKKHDIMTGIATSNSQELVVAAASALDILKYLDEIHNCCEVSKGKPSPMIYLHVAECLNCRPEECLVFEDLCVGIEAGLNAGMRTCAVEDNFSANEREEKKKLAHYYINDYDELLDAIAKS